MEGDEKRMSGSWTQGDPTQSTGSREEDEKRMSGSWTQGDPTQSTGSREGDEVKRMSGSWTTINPTQSTGREGSTGERRMKESLNPIKSQLLNAKRKVKENSDENVMKSFTRIQELFLEMENVFGPLTKLEVHLENKLEGIARQIDSILKNINETVETTMLAEELKKIENDVDNILKNMEERMEEGFKREKQVSDTSEQVKPASSKAGLDKEQRRESDSFFKKCGAMDRLRDMIDDLDLQVKHCFFCLAVFPEDSIIKKRLLIYLWIGWGIVVPVGNNTAEKVAERCFTELVNKGLVNPIYRKHRKIVDSFSMNLRIREVMISEADKRLFFLSEKKTKEILEEIISDLQPDEPIKESLRVVRYSRGDSLALVNVNVHEQYLQFKGNVEAAKKETNSKMEKFTVMQLGRWQSVDKPHIEMESIKFLERFVPWNKLRYLSLQEISRITDLPETIGKLTSLIILNLRACHNLERLPTGIGSLKKLTHLDVSGCYLLDHLPRGIKSLTELQVLKGFVMGNSRSKDPCKLSDLAKLKKLRKLSITIGQESVNVSGEFDKLKEFEALRSLTVTWGVVVTTKPTLTTEPTLKTEPTEPTLKTEPTEPTQPTLKTEPTEPTLKTEPTQPTQPTLKTEPTEPTQPTLKTEPTQPTQTTLKTEPTEPTLKTEPTEPTQPTLKTEPTEPTQTTQPTLKTEPTQPTQPTLKTDPTEPKLTALTFPSQLEKLDIRAFPLKKVPEWLSSTALQKLERLYIRGGKLVSLDGIGSQTVQVLRLRFLKNLSVEWTSLEGMFSRLGYLEVKNCPILKENFKEHLDSEGVWRKE